MIVYNRGLRSKLLAIDSRPKTSHDYLPPSYPFEDFDLTVFHVQNFTPQSISPLPPPSKPSILVAIDWIISVM